LLLVINLPARLGETSTIFFSWRNNHNALVPFLLNKLKRFTRKGQEQKDGVTLRRIPGAPMTNEQSKRDDPGELLFTCSLASQPGNERDAVQQVAEAIAPLGMPAERLDNLKTAVAEAVMNAMEHGNCYQPDKPVLLQTYASERAITVRIHDEGKGEPLPDLATLGVPDLSAKLAGLQTPRGWGLFLIQNLVDELRMSKEGEHQIVELVMSRQNEPGRG
jgi:anti-sigma regulatory factor (Ser/Thr protein kinase)